METDATHDLDAPPAALDKTLQNVADERGLTVGFISQIECNNVLHSAKRPDHSCELRERHHEFFERGFPETLFIAPFGQVRTGSTSEIMSHEGTEVLRIVSGEMIHKVDAKTHHLKAGDLLHFQCNRPHRFHNEGSSTL